MLKVCLISTTLSIIIATATDNDWQTVQKPTYIVNFRCLSRDRSECVNIHAPIGQQVESASSQLKVYVRCNAVICKKLNIYFLGIRIK